ncbi:hypothetical protein [Rubritalea sp.]|uniref:hypothetical protein n=1 Tax=Rubritalea sp. TaxID=2109375 RepID=UPI003EF5BFF5
MIKKSLEENQEHILAALPAEFHKSFKAEMAAAPDSLDVSQGDTMENIKTELHYHPDVDATVIGEINLEAHKPAPPLSEAEQKVAMEEELKNTLSEIEAQS